MKKWSPWILIIAVIAVVGTGFIPTGYDVIRAGAPINLNEFVQYEGGSELEGDLGMTYVASMDNTLWPLMLIALLMEEGVEIVPSTSELLELNMEDLDYQQYMMMSQSKIKAEYIVRSYLKEEPKLDLIGFYPVHYIPEWPYKDEIKVTDILIEMDGEPLESYDHLDQLIVEKTPGEMTTLTLLREGETVEVEVSTYPERDYYGNTFLGIYFEEVFEMELDDNIEWQNIENLGGPSAGLMITLTLLDKMMEESLLKGNAVAGTGTIEIDGVVGPIGGVRQKVIGAAQAGFDYFLVPEDNEYGNNEEIALKTVKEEGLSIKVIPVGSLDDAVEALRKLPKK
jgi:PDZ domain-containing protein